MSEAHDRATPMLGRELGEDSDNSTLAALGQLGSWEWNLLENSISGSAELNELFGVEYHRCPRTFYDYLDHLDVDSHKAGRAAVERSLATLDPLDCVHLRRLPDGRSMWIRTRGRVICRGGTPVRLVGISHEITDQKLAEKDLLRLAFHDELTGLANRTLFSDRLATASARIGRRRGGLAVMFLDLDHFKRINDKYGHSGGDQLLLEVARRLEHAVRPEDTVARFGGDEFAILCDDLAGQPDAERMARRVLASFVEPIVIADQAVALTTSIGVTMCPGARMGADATPDCDTLLREADEAMYQAKAAGRNTYFILDDAGRARAQERTQIGVDLGSAISAGELRVYYQPDIDLGTEELIGVEALVRWHHPARGLLTPKDFISVAEESGAIGSLGSWVIAEVCRQLAEWDAEGMAPLAASVNVSALQLRQPALIDAIHDSLGAHGIAPSRLCLEITESVLMEDVDLSIDALLGLRRLGVRLAIDDFGTGYSSLSYLRRFPVDVVKIDQSFVAGLGVDPAAEAIVAAVVNLSHALGFLVVAEGVETADHLLGVRALNCNRAQGYYWGRPMPSAELADWASTPRTRADHDELVDLSTMISERAEALRAATARPVVVQSPVRLGAAVAGGRSVRTVLDHLLGNAVTYSDAGQPIVLSAASDRHWVRISVTDYGVGMGPDEAARCFEAFWQAGDSAGPRSSGTGMGLFIVRTLVESMGGHVGVKSTRGKGSTFTVALPRAKRSSARPRSASGLHPGVGEDSSILEFMRQIGVPARRAL